MMRKIGGLRFSLNLQQNNFILQINFYLISAGMPQVTSLEQLIASDSLIREYFKANPKSKASELAVQLMREAISSRMNAAPGKHYHVAYIKHNRFLSPSQRQEVAQKVTQIIPINEKPVKIYAKPKVKVNDDDCGPVMSEKEIETREEIPLKQVLPEGRGDKKGKQHVIDVHKFEQGEESKQQSEKYLSPKTKQQQPTIAKNNEKTKQYASPPMKNNHISSQNYYSPKATHHNTGKLNIQSNYKSTIRQEIGSPKALKQDYGKVQSRIKFLIDRDKQSKRMQRALQAQNQKIQKLQSRQERLLLLQYEQQRQLLRAYPHHYRPRPQLQSDSDDSCDPCGNRLSKISARLQAINQRAEGVRDYQHALYATLQQMRDKTYKISSDPIYPMSSSQSEDDDL